MSSQRGNVHRTRAQKHQNSTVFKNNKHDTSVKTKQLNSIEIANVCAKCKNILEWKIKFKKYKMLKSPSKCTKCEQKTVKSSYHIICTSCADSLKVCPKCGKSEEIIVKCTENQQKLDAELQNIIKSLPERKRRTFLRYVSKMDSQKKGEEQNKQPTRDELIAKIESLRVDDGDEYDDLDFMDDLEDDDDNSSNDEMTEGVKLQKPKSCKNKAGRRKSTCEDSDRSYDASDSDNSDSG